MNLGIRNRVVVRVEGGGIEWVEKEGGNGRVERWRNGWKGGGELKGRVEVEECWRERWRGREK